MNKENQKMNKTNASKKTAPAVQTLVFQGVVTAVAPLAVSRPDDNFYRNDTVSRLPRAGAKRFDTPIYFPASTLSGTLRRLSRDLVREATIANTGNDKPFTLDTHYMLTQGVDTTNLIKNEKTSGYIHKEKGLRDANPHLSLYGRWKLAGHLSLGDLIPIKGNDETLFIHGAGARTDDFSTDSKQAQFLSPDDLIRLDKILNDDLASQKDVALLKDQVKELTKTLRSATAGERKVINEQIEAINAEMDEVKASKSGSEESIQRPLDGYEAIVAGTEMSHKMVIGNGSKLEIGLFLETLLRFSEKPYLGARFKNGCGEIKAEWEVMVRPQGSFKAQLVGKVGLSFNEFTLEDYTEDKVLESAFNAWQEAKGSMEKHGLDFTKFLMMD